MPGRRPAVPERQAPIPGRRPAVPERQTPIPGRRPAVPGRQAPIPERRAPEPERRQPGGATNTDLARRRLISRQIRSNAESRRVLATLFTCAFVVLFFMLLAGTNLAADISQMNYEINRVQRENELLLVENAKIEGQIAALASLEKIEERAINELGMVKNKSINYMMISNPVKTGEKVKTETQTPVDEPAPTSTIEAAFNIFLDFLSK